jgi:hypothetical protein
MCFHLNELIILDAHVSNPIKYIFYSKFGLSLQFLKFKIFDCMGLNTNYTFYFIVGFDANKISFME